MIILGIESSCDETGVALVKTEGSGLPVLLADALHSQIEMHQAFGGVVPELASRDHIRRVLPLTKQVLDKSGLNLGDIDVVAYTKGPGLGGGAAGGVGRGVCAGRGAGQAGAGGASPGGAFAVAVFERRPARVSVCGAAGVWRAHAVDAGGWRR